MKKIIPIVVVILFSYIFYIIFTQATISSKTKRVECQAKTTTFEKVFVEEPVQEALDLFLSNNYEIKSDIEYSKYMESHLINILSVKEADEKIIKTINKYIKTTNPNDKKVLIDYYIYENDKNDTGKKGAKSKLYAGYIVLEVKLDNVLIYKIQTDYMNLDAKDIEERMDCAINSFVSIK